MNAPAAPAPRPSPPRHGPGPWGWTVLLALGLAAARIAYLVWLCPYELAGDEAHYWEWSRRLDLSYYSKGPGVAWVVAASTRVFGLHDWSIRLPAVVATLLSMLAIGRLGRDLAGGSDRAGAYAALGFALTPIFIGTSHFMTIDPPYLTCWIAAAWAAWRVYARARLGHWALAHWALFGLAAGIGFLFKYTILLLIPGVLCFAWRHGAEWPRRRVLVGALVALAVLGIAALPVLLWNHAHGWPTLAHLIGNVRLPGGDVVPRSAWGFKVLWPLSYLASPLILLGPLGVLLVAAVLWRNRRAPAPSPATEFAVCCALPVLGFYLVVSLATDVELNWPIAGFTTLGLPVARALAGIPVPPSRAIRNLWRGFAAFGMVALPVIAFTPTLIRAAARLPALGPHIPVEPLTHRVAGHRAFADRVSDAAAALERYTGRKPFVAVTGYWRASLLAYYLDDHPSVRCATSWIGGRRSAYDYFPDTDLRDAALIGRPAILVGSTPDDWRRVFRFERVRGVSPEDQMWAATGYGGPSDEAVRRRADGLTPSRQR